MKYHCMAERLIANSVPDRDSDCWLWTGSRDNRPSSPYGRLNIRLPGRQHVQIKAHRMSYETFVGPIPEGHEVDHRCNNPICINPQHLQAVLPVINKARRRMATGPLADRKLRYAHTARSDALVEF